MVSPCGKLPGGRTVTVAAVLLIVPHAFVTSTQYVVFATGDRLRIRSGVDGATLRTVLRALRG